MSLSPKNENDSNEVASNLANSEEPKISLEQRSLMDPSTERGTGLNELTRTDIFHTSGSAFRLNSSYNNILPNSFFPQSRLSVDEEDSGDINDDDNIFEEDDYYNYNEFLNPYINRQIAQLSYNGIIDGINSVVNYEKNNIINEKDSVKNKIKIFEEFKTKFNKQNQEKKSELKNLFLSGKYDIPKSDNKKNKIINDEMIELELSNGEKIKTNNSNIKKYPNSVLAAYLNPENKYPKRNGHIFIDREPQNFKNLIFYLENNKLPIFKTISEEKKFFSEINYWKIPIHISSKNILKFNPVFCPYYFTLDKKCQMLSKNNLSKGIVLLNKKLTALTPYIEFSVYLNFPNREKKILLALVDENKIEKCDLNRSFETGVPFVFYWDLFGEKIVKYDQNSYINNYNCFNLNKEFRTMELKKFCRCYKNNFDIKYGLLYNQEKHTIELMREDVKLDIEIQNIDPGLTPAFEIVNDNCKIKLSNRNKYHDKFFL